VRWGREPAGPRAATDAELAMGGKVQRVSRPRRALIAVNRRLKIRGAWLAISGARLKSALPEINVHYVLVVDLG
jgi:hypothetical protein